MQEIENKDTLNLNIKLDPVKCPVHNLTIIYINLEAINNNNLLCAKCVTQYKLKHQQLLPIEEIINCNNNTIFDNWPLNEENHLIQDALSFTIPNNDEICKFFKGFRSKIMEKIDNIEEKIISQFQKLEEVQQSVHHYINSISQKDEMKHVLNNLYDDYDGQQGVLNQIIKDGKLKKQDFIDNMNYIVKYFHYYFEYLSIDKLNQFQENIQKGLNDMDQIVNYEIFDLFKEDNTSFTLQKNEKFNMPIYSLFLTELYKIEDLKTNQYVSACLKVQNMHLSNYHKTYRKASYQQLSDLKLI